MLQQGVFQAQCRVVTSKSYFHFLTSLISFDSTGRQCMPAGLSPNPSVFYITPVRAAGKDSFL